MNYLMLDKNDITNVCGVISRKDVLKEISNNELVVILNLKGKYFRNKYVLVEEEIEEKRNKQFKYAKVGESKTKYYYVSVDGEAFTIDKRSNKKRILNPYFRKDRNSINIRINNKEYSVRNLVAYNFIEGTNDTDVVYCADGNIHNCAANNLVVVKRVEHLSRIGSYGHAKAVGLYENDVLVKSWTSARKCAKDLFCSTSCICSTCNGEPKEKMFDVRWLDEK